MLKDKMAKKLKFYAAMSMISLGTLSLQGCSKSEINKINSTKTEADEDVKIKTGFVTVNIKENEEESKYNSMVGSRIGERVGYFAVFNSDFTDNLYSNEFTYNDKENEDSWYKSGYIAGYTSGFSQGISELAQSEKTEYIGVTNENGNTQYAPLESLTIIYQNQEDKNFKNIYVIKDYNDSNIISANQYKDIITNKMINENLTDFTSVRLKDFIYSYYIENDSPMVMLDAGYSWINTFDSTIFENNLVVRESFTK